MARLHGYDLVLGCTRCGIRKRIRQFPEAMKLVIGTILTSEHIQIFEKGCLRCGTCRFEVLSMPALPPPPPPPVGWARKMTP